MSETINGLSLGQVESFKSAIGSDLDPFNFPGSGTNEAEVYDYGDTKKTITLKGVYVATSKEALANWIISLEALQNGDQDTIIYHSDLLDESTSGDYQDGNVTVKVKSFDGDYIKARVLEFAYTIVFLESV